MNMKMKHNQSQGLFMYWIIYHLLLQHILLLLKMEFNIKNLQLDTFQTASWSTSLSNVVGVVEYEFTEIH